MRNLTALKYEYEYIKVRRCGMIANEITVLQSSNEVDVSSYRQLYSVQNWETHIPYSQLLKALTWKIWSYSIEKTNRLIYKITIYEKEIRLVWTNDNHLTIGSMNIWTSLLYLKYVFEVLGYFISIQCCRKKSNYMIIQPKIVDFFLNKVKWYFKPTA